MSETLTATKEQVGLEKSASIEYQIAQALIDSSKSTKETSAKNTETQENLSPDGVAVADDYMLPDFGGQTDLSEEELEELFNL